MNKEIVELRAKAVAAEKESGNDRLATASNSRRSATKELNALRREMRAKKKASSKERRDVEGISGNDRTMPLESKAVSEVNPQSDDLKTRQDKCEKTIKEAKEAATAVYLEYGIGKLNAELAQATNDRGSKEQEIRAFWAEYNLKKWATWREKNSMEKPHRSKAKKNAKEDTKKKGSEKGEADRVEDAPNSAESIQEKVPSESTSKLGKKKPKAKAPKKVLPEEAEVADTATKIKSSDACENVAAEIPETVQKPKKHKKKKPKRKPRKETDSEAAVDGGDSSGEQSCALPDDQRLPLQVVGLKFENRKYDGFVDIDYKPHGEGKSIDEKGNIYEGSFENGKPHGRGKLTLVNGVVYDGGFSRGLKSGQGVLVSRNVKYTGSFQNGKKRRPMAQGRT